MRLKFCIIRVLEEHVNHLPFSGVELEVVQTPIELVCQYSAQRVLYLFASLMFPTSKEVYRQVALQYLVWHLEHCFARRGSGAAQAAQFVRIIWRWRGVCRAFASRRLFFAPWQNRFFGFCSDPHAATE